MANNFQPIDFSKYAELRDLWNMHPSNTEGALYKGYKPAEGESAKVLRRYGELSQQLADEVGSQNYTEALLALGGTSREDLDITSGATNYEDMFNKRQQFLAQGRSVEEADAIEPYRLAALYMGERQPDLNYVQADRARRYFAQYGTPEQIDYTNQLATQLRSAQPQGMMNQLAQSSQPINLYSTTSKYLAPELEKIKLSNIKNYLSSLDGTSYLSLLNKMLGK